jgi:dGTPase
LVYHEGDKERVQKLKSSHLGEEDYRSEWRRDYARLIHSPSFRRLKGKTQLFPDSESDFFRNRLTHSLEVSQIAKSIAIRLNHQIREKGLGDYEIDTDLVEFASLAHDLGHPPFGHIGEYALNEEMIDHGGFEGNAQTLRLLSKIEKKDLDSSTDFGFTKSGVDKRVGLNLTYRSLASIIKYDKVIPLSPGKKPTKGYYISEQDLVEKIKLNVIGTEELKLFTVECQIMDLADDIAYSTYDLEDSFKAGFTNPLEIVTTDKQILDTIASKINNNIEESIDAQDVRTVLTNIFKRIFDSVELEEDVQLDTESFRELSFQSLKSSVESSNKIANEGFYRSEFTSELVGKFVRGVNIDSINQDQPILTEINIQQDILVEIEALKHFIFQSQILSPRLSVVEFRGKNIIHELFEILTKDDNYKLIPDDFSRIYELCKDETQKRRCICDFIAGMTDRYALEFYGRLTSEDPETMFKPH